MKPPSTERLSGRERQILQILFARGQATVTEVRENLPDPPSYSAVRALLAILESKGHVRHLEQGPRYVYQPMRSRQEAGRSMLKQVLDVFYGGALDQAVAALLDASETKLEPADQARLEALIRASRKAGR